jgi:hypothetical protein
MALENCGFMRRIPGSFRSKSGFFEKHHGDVVPNGIDALADITLQSGFVGQQMNGLLAKGTGENG